MMSNLQDVLRPSKGFIDVHILTSANSDCSKGFLYGYRFERLDIVDVDRLEDFLWTSEDDDSSARNIGLCASSCVSTMLVEL